MKFTVNGGTSLPGLNEIIAKDDSFFVGYNHVDKPHSFLYLPNAANYNFNYVGHAFDRDFVQIQKDV